MERPTSPSSTPPRDPRSLAAALARLESRWGSAAVRLGDGRAASLLAPPARLGFPVEGALAPLPDAEASPAADPLAPPDDRVVPTGFPALDAVLGPGGLVRDAQVTLRGDASSGKTTLALRLVAAAQERGAIGAWLDLARAFDPLEAVARGVDLEWLLVLRAADATEGLRLAGALLGGRAVEILVADLPERLPVDREALLRRLAARARQAGARLVTLEPAGLAPALCGALAEAAGLGLDLERRAWIRAGRDVVGQRTQVTVVKNRFGPPGRRVELEIRYADEGDRAAGVGRLLDDDLQPRHDADVLRWQAAVPPGDRGMTGAHRGYPLIPLPSAPSRPRATGRHPPPGRIPASSPQETAIAARTHANPPPQLASPSAPPGARVPAAPGRGHPRRPSLGAASRAGLHAGRAPARDPARDEPGGRARPRA